MRRSINKFGFNIRMTHSVQVTRLFLNKIKTETTKFNNIYFCQQWHRAKFKMNHRKTHIQCDWLRFAGFEPAKKKKWNMHFKEKSVSCFLLLLNYWLMLIRWFNESIYRNMVSSLESWDNNNYHIFFSRLCIFTERMNGDVIVNN